MAPTEAAINKARPGIRRPSEEFTDYCEAEFERRLNSGESFDETAYRKAMAMVLERLVTLEDPGSPA
jgi:hypothetical protein